jgi:hypothetical protein
LHIVLQHDDIGASVRRLASTSYPAAIFIGDPVTELVPMMEQAILNVANNGSIENVDAVDALLQANPAVLERITRAS